jgi:hypothetical protein
LCPFPFDPLGRTIAGQKTITVPVTGHVPLYAKEVLGGLVLTDDGLQRIAVDRERVRTFVETDASG